MICWEQYGYGELKSAHGLGRLRGLPLASQGKYASYNTYAPFSARAFSRRNCHIELDVLRHIAIVRNGVTFNLVAL